MNYIVTFLPVVLPLILILGFKLNSAKTMAITLSFFVLGVFWIYHMPLNELLKSTLRGMFNLTTPIFILIGAILLINVLEYSGALNTIKNSFNKISADQRIQIILIGFLFSALIEGISGFGIPATIAAPILISLGFKPLQAIIVSLGFNSIPVSFGATGIPIKFGLFEPLEHKQVFINSISKLNMNQNEILNETAQNLILVNYVLVPIIVTIMTFLVSYIFVKKNQRNLRDFYEMLPLIIFISILYPSIEFMVLKFIGYSFVSILTPLIMLLIMFTILKLKIKILVPTKIFHKFYGDNNEIVKTSKKAQKKVTVLKSWIPYILVIIILLTIRVVPFINTLLQDISLDYDNIKFKFLYNPGFTFIIISLFCFKMFRFNLRQSLKIIKKTSVKLSDSILVLIPTFILIELFMNGHLKGGDTIAILMSKIISKTIGKYWNYFAPFLGLIGSFINGSATVSNISFGIVHVSIASTYDLNILKILTFQQLGANMGNMICISNVIVVCSIVGIKNKESQILKYTMTIAIILIIFAIILLNIFK